VPPEDGREQVLAAIKAHLDVARAAEAPPPHPAPDRAAAGRCALPTDQAGLTVRFRQTLEKVGGVVTIVRDQAEAAAALARIISERDARRIAVSDGPLATSLADGLSDVTVIDRQDRAALLACDAGLTQCQWGVAETGSLVLCSADEQHRLVSLVPPVHVALLSGSRILGGLDDALQRIGTADPEHLPRAVTFVTGPSRTADIELTLVVGVHGPRELHVIVLEEETP